MDWSAKLVLIFWFLMLAVAVVVAMVDDYRNPEENDDLSPQEFSNDNLYPRVPYDAS